MSTLTAEQILDFERRAAAGEKPVMEWEPVKYNDELSYRLLIVEWYFSVELEENADDPEENGWQLCAAAEGFVMETLQTPTAAQLAAEHLLREDTLPLHKSHHDAGLREGELRGLWRAAEMALALRSSELHIAQADRSSSQNTRKRYSGAANALKILANAILAEIAKGEKK